ncbi:MAG TPA: carboxylating nicotinate-nucleotide diphosphorylase [Chthoniobacterales bacterium]|jgi:nicotinate-nucleotide pyrophosphorylase (carboxylating)
MHDPIALALAEDIGTGDLTARYFIDPDGVCAARIFAKENATLSGIETAAETFQRVDPSLEVSIHRKDGDQLQSGDTVLTIAGKTASIVTAERVGLNFLQRLSGVATLTAKYVAAISGTKARILDTRKTTPGLRLLEKAAVKAGGGTNHRIGLYDMVMVKDNHLLANGNMVHLQEAISRFKQDHPNTRIELEADHLDQVASFLKLPQVDVILLDNMSLDQLRAAVALNAGRVLLEASGGVNLETVAAIAATGVDFISVGALTHSARAVDFSLELT